MNVNETNYTVNKIQELQEKLYLSAKKSRNRRFHALYDKIYRDDILNEAWKKVKSNKGNSGIDSKTIEYIEQNEFDEFMNNIKEELKCGEYHPKPVKRVNIPKKDGKTRPLGIPTVKDRVIQTATNIVISPVFEADFSEESYGFRKGKNAQQALDSIRRACNNNGNWVLDADITGFFDNINHDKLIKLMEMRISDKRVLKLIRKWLKAGIIDKDTFKESEIGAPQGGAISPLLANIYLNYMDYL